MKRGTTTPKVAERRDAIYATLAASPKPVSVRNIFYQMVGAGTSPKTEAAYKTIDADLALMRREGRVPYHWITDGSRNAIGTTSDTDLTATDAVAAYLQAAGPVTSIWAKFGMFPQLWVESRSAAGMITDIAAEWEIGIWPTAGHPSLTMLYEAAQLSPTHIGIMTDYDREGLIIRRNIEAELSDFGGHLRTEDFRTLAVNPDQAEAFGLPEQVGKPGYQIEALPVNALRRMVADWAESLLPEDAKAEYDGRVKALEAEVAEIVSDLTEGLTE